MSEFITQLFNLVRVARGTELFGQLKEGFLLLPSSIESLFNEFNKDSIVAESPLFRDNFDLFGDSSGKRHTAPDLTCRGSFRM